MLLVRTKINKSPIHGIGLFADEDIPKGKRMWEFNSDFDKHFTEETFNKLLLDLPEPASKYLKHYTFKSRESGRYISGLDNDKFTNHSYDPNIISNDGELHEGELVYVAARDIKKGEEILTNYDEFIYEMQ